MIYRGGCNDNVYSPQLRHGIVMKRDVNHLRIRTITRE